MAGKRKPDIPKPLAGRIRAAQEKVRSARVSIVYGERTIVSSRSRINEYERDPQGFADQCYPGHDWNSYPVQTTIVRERERLSYNERRGQDCIAELAEAEAALEAVEEAVLFRVMTMRSSKGRVPWPKPLPSLSAMAHTSELEAARHEALSHARKIRDDARFVRDIAIADERMRAAVADLVAVTDSWMRKLPPEKQDQARDTIRSNLARMRAKEISSLQFLSIFQ